MKQDKSQKKLKRLENKLLRLKKQQEFVKKYGVYFIGLGIICLPAFIVLLSVNSLLAGAVLGAASLLSTGSIIVRPLLQESIENKHMEYQNLYHELLTPAKEISQQKENHISSAKKATLKKIREKKEKKGISTAKISEVELEL